MRPSPRTSAEPMSSTAVARPRSRVRRSLLGRRRCAASTRASSTHLRAADAALAARFAAARAAPDALERKAEAELLIARRAASRGFPRRAVRHRAEVQALEARHHELAPLFVVKRQFVQRKAMNAYKADAAAAFDGPALRAALEARDGRAVLASSASRRRSRAGRQTRRRTPAELDLALRYAAWAAHTPAGRAAHRGGVLFRAPRKLDYMQLVPVEAETRHGVSAWKLDARPSVAPARRLRADRSGHRPRRRRSTRRTTASGATSRARTRARAGLLEKKPLPGDVAVQEVAVRRDARRLPARGAHLRVPQAARRRLAARRAGDDLRRQPDGRRHRPSHLQRLHEVVHLPEAGSGRHPAGGNARC